jgi:hypothetical protein
MISTLSLPPRGGVPLNLDINIKNPNKPARLPSRLLARGKLKQRKNETSLLDQVSESNDDKSRLVSDYL